MSFLLDAGGLARGEHAGGGHVFRDELGGVDEFESAFLERVGQPREHRLASAVVAQVPEVQLGDPPVRHLPGPTQWMVQKLALLDLTDHDRLCPRRVLISLPAPSAQAEDTRLDKVVAEFTQGRVVLVLEPDARDTVARGAHPLRLDERQLAPAGDESHGWVGHG